MNLLHSIDSPISADVHPVALTIGRWNEMQKKFQREWNGTPIERYRLGCAIENALIARPGFNSDIVTLDIPNDLYEFVSSEIGG